MNNTDKISGREIEFSTSYDRDDCADCFRCEKELDKALARIAKLEAQNKVLIEALEYINAGDDVAHGLSRPMMMDAARAALQKIKESTNSKGE